MNDCEGENDKARRNMTEKDKEGVGDQLNHSVAGRSVSIYFEQLR